MKQNKKKNVIIIRSTSIKNDSRVIKESTSLAKLGYSVKIFGWDRDGFLNNDNKIEVDGDDIPILAFKDKAQYGGGMKNLFKLFKFQIWILAKLIKQRKNIDIIHSCDLDTAIPSLIFTKIFKKKLVYDIFDYYIDSHYVPKKIEKIVEKFEINIINKADLTIICTEERRKQIKKARPNKCIVIYNTPEIIDDKIKGKIIKSNSDKIKIGYVGILQDGRLLEEIGEELKKNNNIELHIGGVGKLENYFAKVAQDYSNVYYYGQMKYNDVLTLEKDCDVLFATYNPSIANHKYSAPNKLYEAMALGKPIIVCKNTGIDNIVEKCNIGISIEYKAEQFIDIINYIFNNKLNVRMSENARKTYNEEYDWKLMKKRLAEAYKSL